MTLRLGDTAPDFHAASTAGPLDFHAWAGNSWVVLFSHPKDFTPVCTTELGLTAKLKPEFEKRNVKALAVSVDPLEDHGRWVADIEDTQGCVVDFPLLADPERKIASLYDMIHPNASETHTVRSLFIIDPAKKVRLIITYPASAGRNFNEVLRVIDSLQLTDRHKVATPGNWQPGEDVIIVPAVKNEDAAKLFPEGWKEVRPYLRLVPPPKG